MVVYTFIPRQRRQRKANLCKFAATLIYIVSFKTARQPGLCRETLHLKKKILYSLCISYNTTIIRKYPGNS